MKTRILVSATAVSLALSGVVWAGQTPAPSTSVGAPATSAQGTVPAPGGAGDRRAQRLARRLGDRPGNRPGKREGRAAGVEMAQVWRLDTLTFAQRTELRELQASVVRDIAAGPAGKEGRRALVARRGQLLDQVRQIVGDDQFERARSMPHGQLLPEEILYYPAVSLPGLDATTKAKIAAVYAALAREDDGSASGAAPGRRLARARAEAPVPATSTDAAPAQQPALAAAPSAPGGGERPVVATSSKAPGAAPDTAAPGAANRKDARKENRERSIAFLEVLDALLTDDQLIEVKAFMPEQVREASFRQENIRRLPTLTPEQEARADAVFAAYDDETTADRARREALGKEMRDPATPDDKRRADREEAGQIRARLDARRDAAREQLARILTPEQMKRLEADVPGRRPIVFTPENLRDLASSLDGDQSRRVRAALKAFRDETADERVAAKDLREGAKGDLKSMEMAPVRDKLRQAAKVIDASRDEAVRTIVDTLSPEQLGRLARAGLRGERKKLAAANG